MNEQGEDRTERGAARHARDDDAQRFTGRGHGERGYRGRSADDVPPGSVPGGSYGAGGIQQGGYSRGDEHAAPPGPAQSRDRIATEQSASDTGYGAYGLGEERRGSNRRSDHELASRHRGRPPGFGPGERRGGHWGGRRGGYGGGEPGGMHAWRAGPPPTTEQAHTGARGPHPRGHTGRGEDAPWRHSQFAGRGEFGSPAPGHWTDERGYSIEPARDTWTPRDAWNIPGPYSGRGPRDYRRSETAIHDDVCDRLTRHGSIDASRITVRVEDNEVVLEGFVDSRAAKRMAEDTAESVVGVRDVHNRLRIEGR